MCPRVLLWTEIPPLLVCASLTFISSRPRSEQSLVRWATPQLHDIDALARMVDPALKGIYPAKSLSRFADIVALCVQVSLSVTPVTQDVCGCLIEIPEALLFVTLLSFFPSSSLPV